jgi:hypothetical protein
MLGTDLVTAEISALVAVLAAILSGVQLIVMRTTSRGTILTEAAQIFWNRANRDDRIVVIGLEGKPFDDWTQDEKNCASRVAMQVSQIALLLRHSYADREAFLDYWASWCVRYFVILSPLIASERIQNAGADQGIYFEWLARQSLIHMKKRQWWQRGRFLRLKRATSDLPDPGGI